MSVQPAPATSWPPWAEATASRTRLLVVPTAITRCPDALACLTASTVAAGQLIILSMHHMVKNVVSFNWPECSEADVQSDFNNIDTFLTQQIEQFRGKVQACSRGCSRSVKFSIDSLVSLAILKFFVDIRRQGASSQPGPVLIQRHLKIQTGQSGYHRRRSTGLQLQEHRE